LGTPVQVLAPLPQRGDPAGFLQSDQNEPTHDIAVLPNGVIVVSWAGYDPGTHATSNLHIQYPAPNDAALTMPDGRIFPSFINDTNLPLGGGRWPRHAGLPDGAGQLLSGRARQ